MDKNMEKESIKVLVDQFIREILKTIKEAAKENILVVMN